MDFTSFFKFLLLESVGWVELVTLVLLITLFLALNVFVFIDLDIFLFRLELLAWFNFLALMTTNWLNSVQNRLLFADYSLWSERKLLINAFSLWGSFNQHLSWGLRPFFNFMWINLWR